MVAVFAAGVFMLTAQPTFAQQSTPPAKPLSPSEKRAIENVVRDYIMKNPVVVIEAIQNLQRREQQQAAERAQANLVKLRADLLRDPSAPVGGNPEGDVTIVEFFDYRCGFCKRVFPAIQEVLRTDKNIRYVFKEFPILGPESVAATRAALAAWFTDPKKYMNFHVAMMGSKGALPESRVMSFAAQVGYDTKTLKKAMSDPRVEAQIQKNHALAQALDINGTPAFIIGNEIVRGAIDLAEIRKLVSAARGS